MRNAGKHPHYWLEKGLSEKFSSSRLRRLMPLEINSLGLLLEAGGACETLSYDR